jgi:hypothetical protein
MPTRTHGHDGAGTSRGSGEETPIPPLVSPTLLEAIAALLNATTDNTQFLQEMAGNQIHQRGWGQNQAPRDTTCMEFSETHRPIFVKVEEPLEADEWLHVMKQKFGMVRCTKTQKPPFATQQLRGPTSTWWVNFVAIQPEGHLITWVELKQAFREHYISDNIL